MVFEGPFQPKLFYDSVIPLGERQWDIAARELREGAGPPAPISPSPVCSALSRDALTRPGPAPWGCFSPRASAWARQGWETPSAKG